MGSAILDESACVCAAILDVARGTWPLPSWMVGHMRLPPSWKWARWWAQGSLQTMGCVLLLRWAHCTTQVPCAAGSVGRALVLKVVNWGPGATV